MIRSALIESLPLDLVASFGAQRKLDPHGVHDLLHQPSSESSTQADTEFFVKLILQLFNNFIANNVVHKLVSLIKIQLAVCFVVI